MEKTTLDDLRQKEQAATPAPWEVDYQPPGASGAKCYMCGITAKDGPVKVDVVRQGQTNERTWPRVIKDGEFIAAMRNALPELLAELDDYRNAVTWNVDCVGCAKHLDQSIKDYDRIKELEAENERLKADIASKESEIDGLHYSAAYGENR
jgi:hypothetical protein